VAPPLALTLTVTDFSQANTDAIRHCEPALRERLHAVSDSGGDPVAVQVELAGGAVAVTIDEAYPGPLDGLGLVPGPLGHRMLVSTHAWRTATQASVYMALGPVRDAFSANNLPLAEALGHRTMVVKRAWLSRSRSRRPRAAR
jgi:hypothetical protein